MQQEVAECVDIYVYPTMDDRRARGANSRSYVYGELIHATCQVDMVCVCVCIVEEEVLRAANFAGARLRVCWG